MPDFKYCDTYNHWTRNIRHQHWTGSSSQSSFVNSNDWTTAQSYFHVHELPHDESTNDSCSATINTVLLAHIQMLEAENTKLKLQCKERTYFRIESVADNDNMVCFYTGFVSYKIFIVFFDFLGSSASQLHWGSREGDRQQKHDRKLDPKSQLKICWKKLIIPPLLDGKRQLSPTNVEAGRKIASLRIHVKWAIGRIKCFSIFEQYPFP